MFRDHDLDHSGDVKNNANNSMGNAQNIQERLSNDLSKLTQEYRFAKEDQQMAYDDQKIIWEAYHAFVGKCNDRITYYKLESERHHRDMTHCFEKAANARQSRKKANVQYWNEHGNCSKVKMQEAKEQILHWVNESKLAKQKFDNHPCQINLINAKARVADLKIKLDIAQCNHDSVTKYYHEVHSGFNYAKDDLHERLEAVSEG